MTEVEYVRADLHEGHADLFLALLDGADMSETLRERVNRALGRDSAAELHDEGGQG
jgi:ATP phosphoribosyltransferase regulatory subunit HisZ